MGISNQQKGRMSDWQKLLNENRRRKSKSKQNTDEVRTAFERDYDRILFSTPVRRLADKTQLFPLEKNDSVRTRLTHSHEVANLARGIGTYLAFDHKLADSTSNSQRNLPVLLATIGLAHDLGNPPYGHKGEAAIQSWFKDNQAVFKNSNLSKAMELDFQCFEGNAQTLRLLTKLQLINDEYGLNLTYGTLAAMMKYPVASDKKNKGKAATKKHGFFQSEQDIVKDIWANTGLKEGERHPLTYIMEACDDIAYLVLDAEDAVKKGLVSFSDLKAHLDPKKADATINAVMGNADNDYRKYRSLGLSPAELNDISMQKFRVHAIAAMIKDVTKAFLKKVSSINSLDKSLIEISDSKTLREALCDFNKQQSYMHKSVLEIELSGYNTIRGLMDFLWEAIRDRSKKTPFATYAYQRISENYRRVFESKKNKMPTRYKELQLLTDMVSGMTDSFALSLYEDLKRYHVPRKTKN